jgi:protein transport protein SEC24
MDCKTKTGGRITVVQTVLPTVGPGALEAREDPNQRITKVNINKSNTGRSFVEMK